MIRSRGPNARDDIVGATALEPTNDSTVQGFLDGLPPKGAISYSTTDHDVEVWKFQDLVYVRTPLTLLSPAYIGKASNVSGVNVYTLNDAVSLNLSQDGVMKLVEINR